MHRLPESFLIYKAELKRLELEKEALRKDYEAKIDVLNCELGFLKEQIAAQQEMLKASFEHAAKIEKSMASFKQEVASGNLHFR